MAIWESLAIHLQPGGESWPLGSSWNVAVRTQTLIGALSFTVQCSLYILPCFMQVEVMPRSFCLLALCAVQCRAASWMLLVHWEWWTGINYVVIVNILPADKPRKILSSLMFVCLFILQIPLRFGFRWTDLLHCVQAQVSLLCCTATSIESFMLWWLFVR